jgi:multidrug efflux system membrane fusion protein
VEVTVPNPDHKLLPGMIANVAFQSKDLSGALLIPQDLLVTRLDSNGVFIVDKEQVAHWRPLQLGEIVGQQVEVTGGIRKGERIVSVGMRSLSEGDKVIISREGVCCTDGNVVFTETPARGEGTK